MDINKAVEIGLAFKYSHISFLPISGINVTIVDVLKACSVMAKHISAQPGVEVDAESRCINCGQDLRTA